MSFGAAWAYTRAREGEPLWGGGDGLVDWAPDEAARAADARALERALARTAAIDAPAAGPDIVVIVLDTVRADRMGVYGYDGRTTPAIDAWATEARVYDQMVSNGAWTLPSHASLFTGQPVIAHRACGTPLGGPQASALAPGTPTVAGTLAAAGYRTVGIAANKAFLAPGWGLAQGFDVWLCGGLGADTSELPYPTADRVTALAKQALGGRRDAPMFLFLNYMDAHAPWVPRRGYVAEGAELHRRSLPYGPGWEAARDRLLGEREADPEVLASWSAAYDAELRFLDEHVGELLAALPSLGVGEEDYVFVLSDHGEYLGEHALVEHSKDVYEEVLRVPLLVKGPGYAAGRDGAPIQTHDVASRILAAAGLPPLAAAERTEELQVSELYWTRHRELHKPYGSRFDRVRRAYRLGPYKVILGSDGSREAYDLSVDPGEAKDVAEVGAPWLGAVEEAAEAWLAGRAEGVVSDPGGAEDVEALRALGYLE